MRLASGVSASVRALSLVGVHRATDDEAEADITSFVPELKKKERRAAQRHKANLYARVLQPHAVMSEPAVTKDMSIHGVFLYAEHADHPVGSTVNILVLEQLDEVVRYRARIVRLEGVAGHPRGFAAVMLGREHLGNRSHLISDHQDLERIAR